MIPFALHFQMQLQEQSQLLSAALLNRLQRQHH